MKTGKLIQEPITKSIIGAFYDVYNTLGYGFLEQIYLRAMLHELTARGHQVATEVSVAIYYKAQPIGLQRLDLVVDRKIVLELKSSADLPKTATRQLVNYLRATDLEIGLLLHFGAEPKFYRVITPKLNQSVAIR